MALANADSAIFNGRPATLADMRQLGSADGHVVAQAAAPHVVAMPAWAVDVAWQRMTRLIDDQETVLRESGCTRRQIKAYRRSAMATIQAERIRIEADQTL